jgi:hypothetical protein
MKTLTWICDPGHGWLVVPLDELRALGIAARISSYSYLKDGIAYLEEDCDASVYLSAICTEGVESRATHLNTDAPCRGFPSFRG